MIKIMIFGIIGFIVLFSAVYLYEINFRKFPTGIDQISGERGTKMIENFNAPLNYVMGPYSNKKYEYANNTNNEAHHGWRHPPQHVPLYANTPNLSQGTPLPLFESKTEQPSFSSGPSVDGSDKTPPAMFMFANNQCKPECCPSTYSCSGGCVCTTGNQRNFINRRGMKTK